jgi:hypothetical protein
MGITRTRQTLTLKYRSNSKRPSRFFIELKLARLAGKDL